MCPRAILRTIRAREKLNSVGFRIRAYCVCFTDVFSRLWGTHLGSHINVPIHEGEVNNFFSAKNENKNTVIVGWNKEYSSAPSPFFDTSRYLQMRYTPSPPPPPPPPPPSPPPCCDPRSSLTYSTYRRQQPCNLCELLFI